MPSSRKRLLSVLLDSAASARAWRQRAGPALVRRGEEIRPPPVTSEILAGLHAPSLNFGRAARQSTSVLISLGLPHAPSFFRAICSIPFVRNSESRRERFVLPLPTKIPTNRMAAVNF